jgi:catechol 2,3-dioxygenase-like lactoylglutathione lyase family enzyme
LLNPSRETGVRIMKRLHVNLIVSDLARSVEFYTGLFDSVPTVIKHDYAKWMLDDPRVNFSLSTRGDAAGVDHLGLQAEDDAEFNELRMRLTKAEHNVFEQPDVVCCYARSTKAWVRGPNGVPWETFISKGSSNVYGDGSETPDERLAEPAGSQTGCCVPPAQIAA